MKKVTFIVILLGLILGQFVYAVDVEAPKEYSQLISSYIINFNNKNFLEAAKLFHYPQNYTNQELEEDTNGVSKFLEYFNKEYGDIKEINPLKSGVIYYSVDIAGGDIPYWQKHPEYSQIEYNASFSQEGKGYLIFWFCNITGKTEIRCVKYAISVSKENAKDRMMQIFKGMNDLNNEMMNKNK